MDVFQLCVEVLRNYLSTNMGKLVLITASLATGITLALYAYCILKQVKKLLVLTFKKLSSYYLIIKLRKQRQPPRSLKKALGFHKEKRGIKQLVSRLNFIAPPALLKNTTFIVTSSITASFTFLFCLGYLQNFPAAVMGGIAVVLIMSQIITQSSFKERDILNKQLPLVIRNFASVFADTDGNFRVSLDAVIERTTDPAKKIFTRIRKKLDSGIPLKEALSELEKIAGTGHAMILSKLFVEAERQGTGIQPKLLRLASQMDAMQDIGNENLPDAVSSRLLGIVLHVSIIVLAILTTMFVPDARKYIVHDPIGKTIITLCFVSVIIGIISDRLLNNVSDV